MIAGFKNRDFVGEIDVERIGSTAGIARFCQWDGVVDIANASRVMRRSEVDICRAAILTRGVGTQCQDYNLSMS